MAVVAAMEEREVTVDSPQTLATAAGSEDRAATEAQAARRLKAETGATEETSPLWPTWSQRGRSTPTRRVAIPDLPAIQAKVVILGPAAPEISLDRRNKAPMAHRGQTARLRTTANAGRTARSILSSAVDGLSAMPPPPVEQRDCRSSFPPWETPDLAQCIAGQLASFAKWAGLAEDLKRRLCLIFGLLTREALDRPAEPPFSGLSFINASGLPFQWVLRFAPSGANFGFLCEVGVPGDHPQKRLALSLERLRLACESCRFREPEWLPKVLTYLVPQEDRLWPDHWRSGMWIGVAPSDQGILLKPYFNLNHGRARDRWLRVGWVLKMLGRQKALERLCGLSKLAPADSSIVGLAIDVLPRGAAGRVKIYFRSGRVGLNWLAQWYDAIGQTNAVAELRRGLDLFPWLGRDPYPDAAFTLSVEFHPDSSAVSLKTDLAITKWMPSDDCIAAGASSLITAVGGARKEFERALNAIGTWPPSDLSASVLRFVGLGSESDGSSHVNVYLEPPLSSPVRHVPRMKGHSLQYSICAALEFLMSRMHNASWTDFRLPVGRSQSWVTAYVLARLAEVPHQWVRGETLWLIEESLKWLVAHQSSAGGWGYNSTVCDDADSTSWAIIALRHHERPIPPVALEMLRRCATNDGFATYPEGSSPGKAWALTVPDVTAVAMNAAGWPPDAAERFVSRWLQPNGLLPAYWWTSQFYTWAALLDHDEDLNHLIATAILREQLRRWTPESSFEAALMLSCMLRLGMAEASGVVRRLLQAQQPDGSWRSSALLRLTAPEVSDPWNRINAGPLYCDENRVFTTATVIAAIGRFYKARGIESKQLTL